VGELGYYFDMETAFLSVRRRHFMPTLARWLSVDPRKYSNVLAFYLYSRNSPIDVVDPSGLDPSASEPLFASLKGTCGECGELDLFWSYSAADPAALGRIVQRICVRKVITPCQSKYDAERDVDCCFDLKTIDKTCCYYERIGVIGGPNADHWTPGGPEAPPGKDPQPCISRGWVHIEADVRVFDSNEVEDETEKWPVGEELCVGIIKLGHHSNGDVWPPAWWHTPVYSTQVSVNVFWNCCTSRTASGFMYSSNPLTIRGLSCG
jgi:RHS repeat-associated protein